MSGLRVPILCIITGEGGSGGVLGIGIGDKVFMLEHTYYSVISPEGAAAILLKDSTQSSKAAELMKITAQDLLGFGIVDEIVPEPLGGAHKDPEAVTSKIKKLLTENLHDLLKLPIDTLLQTRYEKYKSMGRYQE